MYTISLKLGEKEYASKGETMLDALTSLPQPDKVFLKGILTLAKGRDTKTLVLIVPRVKRLFFKTAQPFLAKQWDSFFK